MMIHKAKKNIPVQVKSGKQSLLDLFFSQSRGHVQGLVRRLQNQMCYLFDINRALFFWLNLSHEHKELKHIQLDSSLEEILRLLWMMCVFRCSGWTCFTEKCFSCVFIVTFQVISERNLDGYCSTQIPPNCNSWQSGGDCFDCITP